MYFTGVFSVDNITGIESMISNNGGCFFRGFFAGHDGKLIIHEDIDYSVHVDRGRTLGGSISIYVD
jgi:hypothetical protein